MTAPQSVMVARAVVVLGRIVGAPKWVTARVLC